MLKQLRPDTPHPARCPGGIRSELVVIPFVALCLVWLWMGQLALAQGVGDTPGLQYVTGPTAVDDIYLGLSEDGPSLLNVRTNDQPDQYGYMTLAEVTIPSPYGTASISSGKILFTPANCAQPYTSTFYYTLQGQWPWETDSALVTVQVDADDDPFILNDLDVPAIENNCQTGQARDMLETYEADEELFYSFAGAQDLWLTWDSSGAYEFCAYDRHEPVTDTFSVSVTNTAGLSETALLHFVISATNAPLNDWTYHYTMDEESGGVHHGIGAVASERDEPLSVTIVQQPTYGTAGFSTAPQGWTYWPENRTTSYTATILYAITDTLPSSALVTVHLTVTADNDLPQMDWGPWPQDTFILEPYTVTFGVRDAEVDQTVTGQVVAKPDWLNFHSEVSGTITYTGTPSRDDIGTHTFAARAYDGLAHSEIVTGTFDVRPVYDLVYVDGSDGTDEPWYGNWHHGSAYKTITYALERVAYGGTVLVAPGIYTEGITLTRSVKLAPSHQGGTGRRVVLDGSTSAYDVGVIIYDSNVSITGFDIINAERGVLVEPGAENVRLSWCNIYDDWGYGIAAPYATHTIDARMNWWGADDGPSGVGPGSGVTITENLLFDPWLRSRLLGQRQVSLNGQETLEAEDIAGLTATISTTAPVTLTLAQYGSNPQAAFLYESGLFWDVQLADPGPVDELVVRFHLDEEDLEGTNRWLSQIMFWDSEADPPAWVPCSHQAWYRRANYSPWEGIDVTFGSETRPSLSQLIGTEFGFLAMPDLYPEGLSMSRTGGPKQYAPGWNLRFEMMVSNTAQIPIHNVIITDYVPYRAHNWYEITGDLGQPEITPMSTYEYHVYHIGEIQPGQVLKQHWLYHTPSTMADGSGFMYEAIGTSYEGDWDFVGMILRCDHSLSEPTPTPPPVFDIYLPVVLKQ